MDRIYAKAQRERMEQQKKQHSKDLSEILAILDAEEGNDFQVIKGKVIARLEEMIAESEQAERNRDNKLRELYEPSGGWDFGREKAEQVFAVGKMLRLRPFACGDEKFYCDVREMYSINEKKISEDSLVASYWAGTQRSSAFFCVIEHIPDLVKIGYIALKDTTKEPWEVAVELGPDYCGRGYGPEAIRLFLNEIQEITGKMQYQFLVEVDNIPCQCCMRKLGAELVGIKDLVFDSKDEAEQFEERNLGMITEHMEALAEELGIEPRKLLSHVLDYRISLNTSKDE